MPCSPDWVPVINDDQDTDETSGMLTSMRSKWPFSNREAMFGTPLPLHLIFEPLKVLFDSRLFPQKAKDIKEKNDPNGAVSGKKIA